MAKVADPKRTRSERSSKSGKTKPKRGRYVPPADILTHLWDADFVRWSRDRPKTQRVGKETFWFDQEAADRATSFIESFCRHYMDELAGELFVLEPWQRWFVEEMFGWKRKNGKRRYRKAFVFVARKNGKSHLIAALLLYLMIADHPTASDPIDGRDARTSKTVGMGMKVYAAAADKEQARMIFEPAQAMIQQDETLTALTEIFKDSITYPRKFSAAYVLSSKPNTKHGLNAHAVLVDELHAHESRELLDVLLTSQGQRKNPIAIMITTAGVYDENSICHKEYKYAKKVAANPERGTDMLPVIFETDPETDDWNDERVWHKANPGLAGGNMIQIDYLREQHRKAIEDPSYTNTFLQLHLNQWTNQATRWIPVEKWKQCGWPRWTARAPGGEQGVPPFELAGRDCVLGIDMAATTDLCAVSRCFPFKLEEVPEIAERFKKALEARKIDPDGPDIPLWGSYVDVHFWTPSYRLLAREAEDHADYTEWGKSGHLTIVDENAVDDALVESHLRWLAGRYNVRRFCFDAWRAGRVAKAIESEFGDDRVVMVPQGFKSSSACQELFSQIVTGRLIHSFNPVFTYCANNAAVKRDEQGNIRIVKSKSRGRVDGMTATVNALSHLMLEPFAKRRRSLDDMVNQYGGAFVE